MSDGAISELVGRARDAIDVLTIAANLYPVERDHLAVDSVIESLEQAIYEAEALEGETFTPLHLAQRWHVSAKTVRGWIDDGELEAFDAGRGTVARWRIKHAAAQRFAAKRTNAGKAPAPLVGVPRGTIGK